MRGGTAKRKGRTLTIAAKAKTIKLVTRGKAPKSWKVAGRACTVKRVKAAKLQVTCAVKAPGAPAPGPTTGGGTPAGDERSRQHDHDDDRRHDLAGAQAVPLRALRRHGRLAPAAARRDPPRHGRRPHQPRVRRPEQEGRLRPDLGRLRRVPGGRRDPVPARPREGVPAGRRRRRAVVRRRRGHRAGARLRRRAAGHRLPVRDRRVRRHPRRLRHRGRGGPQHARQHPPREGDREAPARRGPSWS